MNETVLAEERVEDTATRLCAICLEAVKSPNITIPTCKHQFCSDCFEGWRSKYGKKSISNSCPQCRTKIPPTKQMLHRLKASRMTRAELQEYLDNPPYRIPALGNDSFMKTTKGFLITQHVGREKLTAIHLLPVFELQQKAIKEHVEAIVHQWDQDIQDLEEKCDAADGDPSIILDHTDGTEDIPDEINSAIKNYDVADILAWVDDSPERINNARSEFGSSLLHIAVLSGDEFLVSMLLQRGADVEAKDGLDSTPLFAAVCMSNGYFTTCEVGKVLLQWGARIDQRSVESAMGNGYKEFARLMSTPFGGRRCELIGLKNRPDLNGMACTVGRYCGRRTDRYEVTLEAPGGAGMRIKPCNLKLKNRTPSDPGVVITYVGKDPKVGNNLYERDLAPVRTSS
jgi:Zinc finger, C3HC4 type (RING finger)/Ankyrin repeat